jgi:glucose/arabinose dehydrogenase
MPSLWRRTKGTSIDRPHQFAAPAGGLVERLEPRILSAASAGFVESTFVSGLASPTLMDFAPDGRLFVSEQGGELRVIQDGQLLATPFVTLPVDSSGERGLLGVAFDPNFATDHYVYVYWTDPSPVVHNQVSRFTADGNVAVPGSEVDIFDLPPLSAAENHNGGSIHFGADGNLYISVGDNALSSHSQSLDTTFGKLLRINPDGSIPTDNPFYNQTTGSNQAIWAMGLRNPFTFAIQPGTGRIFINDVGLSTWEEIDDGIAGANYGWPITEGDALPGQQLPPNYQNPIYEYNHGVNESNGVAITGSTFYDPPDDIADAFPASYDGDYFFADYGIGFVKVLHLNQGSASTGYPVSTFGTGLNYPTDMKVGPDGSLYVLEHGSAAAGGAVVRFNPASAGGAAASAPDLIGIVRNVPASVVEGNQRRVIIRITNAGGAIATGSVGVNLLLSTDQTLGPSDVPLASRAVRLRLRSGASGSIAIPSRVPSLSPTGAAVAAGIYYLIAQIDPLSGSALNSPASVAVSMTPVSVATSPVDLSGSFITIAQTPPPLVPGHRTSVVLQVADTGAGTAAGVLSIGLDASQTGTASTVDLPTFRKPIHLAGGRSVRLRLTFTVPRNMPAGTYQLQAILDPANRFAESNEFNNDITDGSTFSVD